MEIIEKREECVTIAKLQEQCERFEEVCKTMVKLAKLNIEFTAEERALICLGYKNVIGALRTSWRKILRAETKERSKNSKGHRVKLIKNFRSKIEKDMSDTCFEIINILDNNLIPSAITPDSRVFFKKMKGDYYRYLTEFRTDDEKADAIKLSQEAYQDAWNIACSDMSPTSPITLGLALNFSVFYYEVLDNADEANKIAKKSFDDAIAELDQLSDKSYQDSTLLMQLIRDNLALWEERAKEAEKKKK